MAVADDFSWSKPTNFPSGVNCAIGYISPDTSGKNISLGDIARFHGQGVSILLVWESYAQAASGGAIVGSREGASARAQALSLGYPVDGGALLYFVLEDPNRVDPSAWPAIEAYARAASAAVGHPIGGYGSQALIEHLLDVGAIVAGWQVGGWSSSVSTRPGMCLYQRLSETVPVAGTDEDAELHPSFGQWNADGSVSSPLSPPTPSKVIPMYSPPLVLEPIAASAASLGGVILVSIHGGVYTFGCPFYGAPEGQAYWGARQVAQVSTNPQGGYTVTATTGETYHFGPGN